MKIVHFSDPHAGGPAEDWMAYIDKRWVGAFNYQFRRKFKHDLKKLENAVSYILDTRPDVAVCTGDLTSSGQPGEFEKVRGILAPLRDSAVPLIYLPGNHDCYVPRPRCVAAMKGMVDYLANGRYTFDALPIRLELAGAEFLLFNTSRPSNLLCSWGFTAKSDIAFIERECSKSHSLPRIMVTHYPMLDDHPYLRMRHRLFGQKPLIELLKAGEIDLSMVGHVHYPSLKVDADGRGECCAGSVTRNGSMVEIDCDPATRTFRYRTITL